MVHAHLGTGLLWQTGVATVTTYASHTVSVPLNCFIVIFFSVAKISTPLK